MTHQMFRFNVMHTKGSTIVVEASSKEAATEAAKYEVPKGARIISVTKRNYI